MDEENFNCNLTSAVVRKCAYVVTLPTNKANLPYEKSSFTIYLISFDIEFELAYVCQTENTPYYVVKS